MKILVTGGAGFIGSHYVRAVLGGAWGLPAPDRVIGARQADVRRQPGQPGTRRATTRGCGSWRATSSTASLVDRADGRGRRGRPLRRREPRRPLDPRCRRLRDDQRGRHPDAAGLGAARTASAGSCTCRPTRSTGPSRPEAGTSSSRWSRTRRTRPPRRPATCWPAPYHRTHGLPVCVTRCSNNYGPYQFPEKVIPLFVTNLLDGGTVPLYGEGANVRDWLHVDDHCRGIHLVLGGGRPGEVYNIGGGTELTNKELTGGCSTRAAPTGTAWSRSRTARVTTCATRSTSPRSATELGYQPAGRLRRRASPTPSRWYARPPRLVGAAEGTRPAVALTARTPSGAGRSA